MGVKKYKPVTPSRRWMTVSDFKNISKKKPEKSLIEPIKKKGGRNHKGRTTINWRGGGHKRQYRKIDFKRDKMGIPGKVKAIEYDPNRSARIALIYYKDGEKRYILAPDGLTVGKTIMSGENVEIEVGNNMYLKNIPLGMMIHNLELRKGGGAKIVRAAGTGAQLLAKEGRYAHVKLPSGEVRLIGLECRATIGQVGNIEHDTISYGKAGRRRWLGKRPRVRGVAMNPVDHPMGGGEGRSSGGRPSSTPWGQPTKGLNTRKARKPSDKFIVKRRKK